MTQQNQVTVEVANTVTTFFRYMWNLWTEEECMEAFKEVGLGNHFWKKWSECLDRQDNYWGAVGALYASMTDGNRDLLIKRANKVYAAAITTLAIEKGAIASPV